MLEKICFYYTNDFHSNFTQWTRVVGFLKKERAHADARGQESWLFDIGDHMDRVHAISEATLGQANVQLLNEAGYDAVTLGNNEGITLPFEALYHLYDKANFAVVCGNLHARGKKDPAWLLPSKTFTSKQGTKIGVIGLTAAFYAFYQPLGWQVEDPYACLAKQIEQMRADHDIVILLSHLGLSEDEAIARRFPEIDIIMGGHTHHLLKKGQLENNVLLSAAGKGALFAGVVQVAWDTKQKKLVSKAAYATDISAFPADKAMVQELAEMEKQAEEQLSHSVAYVEKPIQADWFHTTPLMESLTDVLKTWTNADCAMLNAGVLLEGLPAGNVTAGDLHQICPHPINPAVVEVTGDELLEIIRASQTQAMMEYPLKGFGFRGKLIGKMIFSGITFIHAQQPAGNRFIKSFCINGQPMEKDRLYQLATADSFTFGRLFPEIAKAQKKAYFLPEFLRDLLPDALLRLAGAKQ